MQSNLTRLVRELKNEQCPQRVRDQVRGRISARESSTPRLRLAIPIGVAVIALACGLIVGQWQVHYYTGQARLAQQRARVAHQAEGALGLVGSVLLNAGSDSGQIISDRAVPPLRNSFEIAKNKITQHINL